MKSRRLDGVGCPIHAGLGSDWLLMKLSISWGARIMDRAAVEATARCVVLFARSSVFLTEGHELF